MDRPCLRVEGIIAWKQDGEKREKQRTLFERILYVKLEKISTLHWDREKKGSQKLVYMGVKQ
jgi:hypothetical protein